MRVAAVSDIHGNLTTFDIVREEFRLHVDRPIKGA